VKELLKKVPAKVPNGVALFVGGGMAELVFPPQPLKRPVYQCGKGFELAPLQSMLKDDQPTFGVVVIDGQSAVFATSKGVHGEGVKVLKTITTHNRGRCRRGGQSALRFDRIRDQVEAAFVGEAAEVASSLFLGEEVVGLLLAGPANLKHLLGDSSSLAKQLKAKVVAKVETGQGGRAAIPEALRRGAEPLASFLHAPENLILVDFFEKLQLDDTAKLSYGRKETLAALEAHAVKKLLVSRSMAESTLYTCLGRESAGGAAEHASLTLADYLLGPNGVAQSGAELVWITAMTEEGVRFTDGFGGLAAYLHWPFECVDECDDHEEERGAAEDPQERGGPGEDTGGAEAQGTGAGAGGGAGFGGLAGVPPPPGLGFALRAQAPVWSPPAVATAK